jgi:hypothetical protein
MGPAIYYERPPGLLADGRWRPYLARMAKGIYRTVDGFVQVDYGTHSTPMPRKRYQDEGYQPPFETLPSEPDYLAAQQKAQNGANRSTDRGN